MYMIQVLLKAGLLFLTFNLVFSVHAKAANRTNRTNRTKLMQVDFGRKKTGARNKMIEKLKGSQPPAKIVQEPLKTKNDVI